MASTDHGLVYDLAQSAKVSVECGTHSAAYSDKYISHVHVRGPFSTDNFFHVHLCGPCSKG